MNDHASFRSRLRFLPGLLLAFAFARSALVAAPAQNFTDADGDAYTVKLKGPGTVAVTLDDPDLDGKGPVAAIVLASTDATSVLTITVAKVGDGRVKVGAITGADAVKTISAAKCDLTGTIQLGRLESLRIGDVAAGAGLALPVTQKVRPLAFTARDVAAMQLAAPSSTLTFKARSITGGAKISAAQIAAFDVTGGNCEADIAAPGKLVSLSVKGGDFSGRIAAGKIGTVSIAKDAAGKGGGILNSTITAKKIGTLLLTGDLADSLVLAGATLGEDGALGGIGPDADTFAAGKVGTVRIKGSMTNSILGAGFAPVDGKFRDVNDGAIGGVLSPLTAFTVKGQMDAQSFVGAGALPKFVFIGGVKIKAKRDARFISREVTILPEPAVTQLDQTTAVPAAVAVSFLYTGANAVQTGVAPDAIKPVLAAVLRGRVLRDDGLPLPGVTITLLGRPEFGQTHSRTDGVFDMAVNGGSPLTVKFDAPGFSSVQRRLDPAQQDFNVLADVVMIGVDAAMTAVQFGAGAPMQMHEATMQNDASGPRHAALMFQPGTSAMLKMADGTTQPAASLTVRATEFTVGPNGPLAMPGALPSNSAYTYCADLSADEADAAGAASVEFDKPVYLYVENFLHFEIGIDVPSGFFNKAKGQWEAGPSGRIIKIISITAGTADLDVNGDGTADTGAALTALAITDTERAVLGAKYATGASLWRIPIPHFSPWDANWSFGPPADAGPPPPPPPPPNPPDRPNDPPNVFIETQEISESLPVTGTPYSLNYRSTRVAGNRVAQRIPILLSGATVPASLKRIEMEVTIAGRTFTQDFPAQANQTATFEWDGLDAFGRSPQGRQPAKVRVGFVYDGSYQRTTRFGSNGNGTAITGDRTRQEITLSNRSDVQAGTFDLRRVSLGGWTLDAHHVYDVGGRVLYQGDGTKRSVQNIARVIEHYAGTGVAGFSGDGGPAKSAQLNGPSGAAIGPDGALYLADFSNHRIRRVDLNGIISTYAGSGGAGFSGDGGPAKNAEITVAHIRFGPDGSLYTSVGEPRVRRIDPGGIITTFAGNGSSGISGDDGPAINAGIGGAVAVPALDGTVYLGTISPSLVRAVKPDGTIIRVAGGGGGGDGGPALNAALSSPTDLAIGPDQSLLIGDTFNNRVRRVGPDGIITTFAGGGNPATGNGDGGPATQARVNFQAGPSGTEMAHDAKGNVYFTERTPGLIRCVDANGIISTIAGNGTPGNEGDGGPATAAKITPAGFAVGPDGTIYITDGIRVRRVSPPLPGFNGSDIAIPSEDGAQLYRFDAAGRHLSTVNALTGAVLLTFSYNTDGQLVKLTDGDGNVTTIERAAAGTPSGIVAPHGQRTVLAVDANGSLGSVQAPGLAPSLFAYDAGGLLQSETLPTGDTQAFTYDTAGRLTRYDPSGPGFTDLSRTGLPSGFFVTTTSALGVDESFQIENFATGDELRTHTDAAGLITTTRRTSAGVATSTDPDGTLTVLQEGGDPRWASQTPLSKQSERRTPAGRALRTTLAKTVTLANAENPLSLTAQTETATINGRIYTNVFDAATRTFTGTTPVGRRVVTELDAAGRKLTRRLGNFEAEKLAYDAQGRLATITRGAGAELRQTTYAYGTDGLLASITDPLGGKAEFAYDAAGRLTRQTLADGRFSQYVRDALGQVTSFTPPGRAAHQFVFDTAGKNTGYTAPLVGADPNAVTYAYNADGLPTLVTRPGGETIAFNYDAATGRLATQTIAEGNYTFAYHPAAGHLQSIAAPGGSTLSYTFDGFLTTGLAWSGSVAGNVTRVFNDNFQLISESINGGSAVAFQYDNDQRLTNAGDLTIARDTLSAVITGTTLGSVGETFARNNFGEITGHTVTFGGAPLFGATFTHDKLGRIATKIETVGGATENLSFTYDPAGRLITVLKDGAPLASHGYDTNGNRTSTTRSGTTTPATYDAQDRLVTLGAATYASTAAGDLLSKTSGGGTTTYDYDALGNLRGVALPGGVAIAYVIDGQGRRIGKRVNGTLTQGFLYHAEYLPAAELDGSNAVVSRFIYGSRLRAPDYMVKGGVTYRFIADHLDSVRLVVNTSTGAIAQRLDYDEFGRVVSDTAPGFQPLGFAGGLYDADTGLTRFGARDYDAPAGRWTRKDPILFGSGDANVYAYVLNDPVNFNDPSGLSASGPTFVRVDFYNLRPNFGSFGFNTPFAGGHAAIGIGAGPAVGNYYGGVRQEGGPNTTRFGPPDRSYRIPISAEQACKLKKFIEKKSKENNYDVVNNNCSEFVADALREIGIDVGQGFTPNGLEISLNAGGFSQQ